MSAASIIMMSQEISRRARHIVWHRKLSTISLQLAFLHFFLWNMRKQNFPTQNLQNQADWQDGNRAADQKHLQMILSTVPGRRCHLHCQLRKKATPDLNVALLSNSKEVNRWVFKTLMAEKLVQGAWKLEWTVQGGQGSEPPLHPLGLGKNLKS